MKKTMKKLSLKSETVRTLTPAELGQVVGGKTTAVTCTCTGTATCGTAICRVEAAAMSRTTAMRCGTGG